MVPADGLRDLLASAPEPQAAVDTLVEAAHRAGAPDNIACVVADVLAPLVTSPLSSPALPLSPV